MNQFVVPFLRSLFFVILLTLGLHLWILSIKEIPIFENKILLSYFINTILVILIFIFLYFFRHKYKEQLGFLYMIGSFVKFIFFFLFFYPSYHKDGSISKVEFLTFFTPYIICLVIETYYLIKLLNSRELNK